MEANTTSKYQVHGVALEFRGVGILMLGESGSGKSSIALTLLTRGGKLVADDAVIIRTDGLGRPIAKPHRRVKDVLFVRDAGLIRVSEVFGTSATTDSCAVDICFLLGGLCEYRFLEESFSGMPGIPVRTMPLNATQRRDLAAVADIVEETVWKFRNSAIAPVSFEMTRARKTLNLQINYEVS